MSCQSLLASLRRRLLDAKGKRYTDDDYLLELINEGMCEVFEVYPKLFAKPGMLTLNPAASCQCAPDCCEILSLRGVFNGNDEQVAQVLLHDADQAHSDLRKPSCLSGIGSTDRMSMVHAYVDPNSRNCLTIDLGNCPEDGLMIKGSFACKPDFATADGDCDNFDCAARAPILNYAAAMIQLRSNVASERERGRMSMQLFTGALRARMDAQANAAAELEDDDG